MVYLVLHSSFTYNHSDFLSTKITTLIYFSDFRISSLDFSSWTHADVVYDGLRSNYKNFYNPRTGRFIAPIKGLYVFTWETVTAPEKVFDTELLVNGERVMINNCNYLTFTAFNHPAQVLHQLTLTLETLYTSGLLPETTCTGTHGSSFSG